MRKALRSVSTAAKISKLTIRKVGETRDLCSYDRGWDIEPGDEVKSVYSIILSKYN